MKDPTAGGVRTAVLVPGLAERPEQRPPATHSVKCLVFRAQGCRVECLVFSVQGSGLRVWDFLPGGDVGSTAGQTIQVLGKEDSGNWVQGSIFKVQGLGYSKFSSFKLHIQTSGFDLGFRVYMLSEMTGVQYVKKLNASSASFRQSNTYNDNMYTLHLPMYTPYTDNMYTR